jgi:hypothetical protein
MDGATVAHETGMRAWDWVHDHRDHFRPPAGDGGGPAAVEWLKPVGELAMVAGVLVREGVAGARHAASARQLLDFAWHDLLEDGDVLDRCQRDNPLLAGPAEHYAVFHDRGYRNPRLEETLRVMGTGVRAASAVELLPTRRLSVAHAEHRIGSRSGGELDGLLRNTLLGHLPEPWTVEQNAGYSITHAVFHVTGWGARPDRIPPEIVDYLRLWTPVWKHECGQRRLWDLLGEWLAVDACLPDAVLDVEHWLLLASAQAADGALPTLEDFPVGGDSREIFDFVHHPTLVTAFAGALATSRALTALVS